MSRLSYPALDALPEEAAEAVARFPVQLNAVRATAHACGLVGPLLDLVLAILRSLALRPRHRELLILLVSYETDCDYEWVQHLPQAQAVGLTEIEIARLIERRETAPDPVDEVLLSAGREYLATTRLGEEAFGGLRRHFSEREIVEILFVLGTCRMFTLAINALDLEIDPVGEVLVERLGSNARKGL